MQRISCFDFDGTITTKDTLLEFIRYTWGTSRFVRGFLIHSPLLVLMKLHLYSNARAKEKIFTYFFGGETMEEFNAQCTRFARNNGKLLREPAKTCLQTALRNGEQVYIISASIDNWVKPFFGWADEVRDAMASGQLQVLGTCVAEKEGKITGRFLTANCYGQEKVNRLTEKMTQPRQEVHITAYGDSRGDKEMLAYADQGYFKPFRR